ncbi:MAG: sugar ABC transporter ATP-binding protein [Hamadaea sp.]|uniref:Sugar ABC transporter ATP-binding protein n=1 Tax=Glycomyces artemisiae TaxID=1076443 RepID=A0A850C8Z2_9ACTN|nr:sugar ABC transporter ATP-binding protein [Hamadaea sp.]NUQ88447.1 sugar ABC transporter ATP-binding protein [Glycomyces artemisiae]NUT36477.1 sugar ABC transporter ATP-binding protein [Hamadaea sp.]
MTEPTPALQVGGLTKSFGATRALDGVSFTARPGTIHALLGGNGSGKSTLIKILAGVQPADAGVVRVAGRALDARAISPVQARELGLRFVHQQTSTFAELSVLENLFLGHGFDTGFGFRVPWRRLRARAESLLGRFHIEVDPGTRLSDLRPATQTMVAIARALQDQEGAHEGVLVLDEPTASLPAPEVAVLLAALRRFAAAGQAIVYVTHRLDEVLEVADTVTVLRDGRLVETRPREGLTRVALSEMIMGRSVAALSTGARGEGAAPAMLRLRDVHAGPLRGLDLEVGEGEVVGIAGLLGSGRSTVLRAVFGLVPPARGTIEIDGRRLASSGVRGAMRAGIAFVPEDRAREGSFAGMTVLENLSMPSTGRWFRAGRLRHRAEARQAAADLRSHRVKAASVHAAMGSLSGGNQQKVVVARWLTRAPRLLLLDEPSQGIDVGARFEIWELVRRATAAGTAVLVVSSDLEELAGVCDRVVVLRGGRVRAEVRGGDLSETHLEHLIQEAP